MTRRITPYRARVAIDLFLAGHSRRSIARLLGLRLAQIDQVLRKAMKWARF